jgi:putative Mg2+ transporter-C (MgtC) family protein
MATTTFGFLAPVLAAIGVGIVIGFNRDIEGKPIGMRTLALVSLGAVIVCLSTINYAGVAADPAAVSRVLQGVIQGILTGIGFIGAGVVLRDRRAQTVHGLTTAATVWVTAALGIASALGAWSLVLLGTAASVFILVLLRWLERLFDSFEK